MRRPRIAVSASARRSRPTAAGAILAPGDDLGDHRVVERRHRVALPHPGIDPGDLRRRETQPVQRPGLRQEVALGVFGVKPRLDRMAVPDQILLMPRQCLAGRHAQLPFDEVEARHRLGHRMLDLEPRVHLDKVELAGGVRRGDEFDGAGAGIADRPRRRDRRLAHRPTPLLVEPGRRSLLDHLLMAALDRAVAVEDMDGIAVPVGEDLHLDMPRAFEVFLDQQPLVAKRTRGLALCRRERRGELARRVDDPHAAPAAAGRGLDQHRKADPLALPRRAGRGPARRRDSPAPPAPRPAPSMPLPPPSTPSPGSPPPAARQRPAPPPRRPRRNRRSPTESHSPDAQPRRRSPAPRRRSRRC